MQTNVQNLIVYGALDFGTRWFPRCLLESKHTFSRKFISCASSYTFGHRNRRSALGPANSSLPIVLLEGVTDKLAPLYLNIFFMNIFKT